MKSEYSAAYYFTNSKFTIISNDVYPDMSENSTQLSSEVNEIGFEELIKGLEIEA